MTTIPDLRQLPAEELDALFVTAQREHAEIRAAEPSPLDIIDPNQPDVVLTEEMRAAAAKPWRVMQAVVLEKDRRRTQGETDT